MNAMDCKTTPHHRDAEDTMSRRSLLRWGVAVSAGIALPSCGGGDAATEESLPQPLVLTSKDGVLELHLNVRYADLSMAVPDSRVCAGWKQL